MRGQQQEIERLKARVDSLEKRLVLMEDAIHRYKRTPYDRLYMFARRVKDYIKIHLLTKSKPAVQLSATKEPLVIPETTSEPVRFSQELPGITVIIPTYKKNEYLKECVASVLNQDYDPEKVEIILSVNGKDVDYATSLEKYYGGEARIRVVYTPKAGASAGRNYAKQFIRTEYVTYLDDDDYFTKGYLREMAVHTGPEISMVCGRLIDLMPDGSIDEKTYVNRALNQAGQGVHAEYLKIGSLFSAPCAKLYRTSQVTEIWGEFDESLVHTEDVVFWVENIYKPMRKIYTCNGNTREALVRRQREDSRSRPDKEKSFSFYITDRITLIERFSKYIFTADRSLEYKRFVLTKIDASTQIMLRYYQSCSPEEQARARQAINSSKCLFLNRSLFAEKKAIAFCHNFVPAADASAYVASKRLPQICEYLGEPLAWTVVCANMSKQRTSDPWWEMFFARYQYVEKKVTPDGTYFNEAAQLVWGQKAFKMVKDEVVPYIYSRSMWAGSHVAARLYKQAHPETVWIAEFSDPIYMGTDGKIRPASKTYTGDQEDLNTFWKDIETAVLKEADKVIFTNENQLTYMLDCNPTDDRANAEKKALVWHHPKVSARYADIVSPSYVLDESNINIGYFGTFYANRSAEPLFEFLKNQNVHIHIFTAVTNDLSEKIKGISERVHLHTMVSHLEFLSIAKRMDYLFLNDIRFPGQIVPYLPSKLADYLSVGTTVLGLVYPNTPMSQLQEEKLIKLSSLDEFFIKALQKNTEGAPHIYRSDVAKLEGYQDEYLENRSRELIIRSADSLKNGITDCGFSTIPRPSMYDSSGKICWDFTQEQVGESRNTFYLWYRGLRHLYILAAAYDSSGDYSYLQLGSQILSSFYAFFQQESLESEMLFNDHAQAERILNIIYFWEVAVSAGVEFNTDAAVELVSDAVEKLSGVTYYQKNHNHGIIVDKACLVGLYFLNRSNFASSVNQITMRLKQQVEYAFGPDGVHKENSIDYHYIVLDLLLGCKNFYQYVGHPYQQELDKVMNVAVEYLVYALKPNLKRPIFGDSKGMPASDDKKVPAYIETYGNPYMQYIASQGREGECPPVLLKWFSSGYLFMRECFKQARFKDATWISLKAGFSTRVHKHSDDLSICLYSKGHDIFVDPGMTSFMPGDPTKNYMESLPAHNTVCIKDVPYQVGSGNGWAFKIQKVQHRDGYDYAMASSRGYTGTAIYRHLYYLRQMDVVVIHDDCISEIPQTYAQYFHLSADMILPEEMDRRSMSMMIKEEPYTVTLQQVCPIEKLNILSGEETQPMSLMSIGFNRYLDSKTLEYTKTGMSVSFVSVMDIHQYNDEPCRSFLDSNTLTIEKLGRKIVLQLEKTEPVSVGTVTTNLQAPGTLVIRNDGSAFTKHTVYAFDEESGNVLKLPYTREREFTVDLQDIKHATLVYFVSNDTGESLKGILGKWNYDCNKAEGGCLGRFSQYEKLLEPWGCSLSLKKSSAPEYVFYVQASEQLNANVSWWVYRNGALYDHTLNKQMEFRVTLDTPGEYVIMCSLRNKYFGEFFFQQTEKIIID